MLAPHTLPVSLLAHHSSFITPTAPPGRSSALKPVMLVMLSTKRILQAPVLPLPKPCREVWLPLQAQSRARGALLARGCLPCRRADKAQVFPSRRRRQPAIWGAQPWRGNGTAAWGSGALEITRRGYRCCAQSHLGANPAVKSRRFAQHRQLRLLPSYQAVVSRPDGQEQRA